jgi:hypothetical protein
MTPYRRCIYFRWHISFISFRMSCEISITFLTYIYLWETVLGNLFKPIIWNSSIGISYGAITSKPTNRLTRKLSQSHVSCSPLFSLFLKSQNWGPAAHIHATTRTSEYPTQLNLNLLVQNYNPTQTQPVLLTQLQGQSAIPCQTPPSPIMTQLSKIYT